MHENWGKISELLIKYHNGGLTSLEETELQEWAELSEANQSLVSEIQDKQAVLRELEKLDPSAKHEVWESIRKIIVPDNEAKKLYEAIPIEIPVKKIPWIRYAAAAIVIGIVAGTYLIYRNKAIKPSETRLQPAQIADIGPGTSRASLTLADGKIIALDSAATGLISNEAGSQVMKLNSGQLAYKHTTEKTREIAYNSLTTPSAAQYQLMLPDGTKVWLNNTSSLRYPTRFAGAERMVELKGEAYFEVVKNKSMPFSIKSGAMKVEVLGTNVNLMSYEDEDAIKTTLLEGAVKVMQGGNEVLLRPGEQSSWDRAGKIRVSHAVDVEKVVAWKNGYFHFDGTDLPGVLRQLARWYDVDVQYVGQIPTHPFSGEIQRSLPLSKVLKGMEDSQIHFTIEGRKIIVRS